MDHVMQLLDTLLDVSVRMSLDRASASGSNRLAEQVYNRVVIANNATLPPRDAHLLHHQLGSALSGAVARGHMALVLRIHELHPHRLSVRLLPLAAANGDLRMLQWLLAHRTDDFCTPLDIASDETSSSSSTTRNGLLSCCLRDAYDCANRAKHFRIIKWLLENGYDGFRSENDAQGDAAAGVGDMEMVKWFHDENYPGCFTTEAIDQAARGGYADIVVYLLANRSEGFTWAAIHYAVAGGHDEIHQLVVSSGRQQQQEEESEEGVVQDMERWAPDAAHRGCLELLQTPQYTMKDPQILTCAIHNACASGHLNVVQWLVNEYTVTCPRGAIADAARGGHVHVLEWINHHEQPNATKWGVDPMDGAAQRGLLATVQWLHANRQDGCSANAMDRAAGHGHVHVVQWLHEHRTQGCTTNAMDDAAARGHLDVVKLLHANRTEGCTKRAIDAAAASNHQHVVEWLHENRTEGFSSHAITDAAANGHLEMFIWLDTNSTERWMSGRKLSAVAPSVLKWVHFNRPSFYWVGAAWTLAAGRGDVATLEFLREHDTEDSCLYNAAVEVHVNGHWPLLEWFRKWYPAFFEQGFVPCP